jgi:hypothetical protein
MELIKIDNTVKTRLELIASLIFKDNAKAVVETEIAMLEIAMLENEKIAACTDLSKVMALNFALKNGLSLDPTAGLIYLIPRKKLVKDSHNRDVWIDHLHAEPSVKALVSQAYRCGKLVDIISQEVKYDDKGRVASVHTSIQTPYGRKDYIHNGIQFRRWAAFSHKNNSRNPRSDKPVDDSKLNYANPLYFSQNGSIDESFAKTKALKNIILGMRINIYDLILNSPKDKIIEVPHQLVEVDQKEAVEEVAPVQTELSSELPL